MGEAKETTVDISKDKGSSKNPSQPKSGQDQNRGNDRSRQQGESMPDQERPDRSRSSNDR